MPDEKTPEEIAAEQAAAEAAEQERLNSETDADASKALEADLPEEIRNELAMLRSELPKARAEAANYRVKLREAEQVIATHKPTDEWEAELATLSATNASLARDLLVQKVSREYDLDDVLTARLSGDDEAALQADAKQLARYMGAGDLGDLGGGLDPLEEIDDEPSDPRELARKYGRGRKNYARD